MPAPVRRMYRILVLQIPVLFINMIMVELGQYSWYSDWGTGCRTKEVGSNTIRDKGFFSSKKMSRPALGPTQPSI